jgi:hypothetical protein
MGRSRAALRNSLRAFGSSALYRWNCSHIVRGDGKESVVDELFDKIDQVLAKQFRLDIEFVSELSVSFVDIWGSGDEFPHARAGSIQAKIAFGLEIEENRFAVEMSHQHVGRSNDAICKCHHAKAPERTFLTRPGTTTI